LTHDQQSSRKPRTLSRVPYDEPKRSAIRADLSHCRKLNIEAKALRCRLDQNARERSELSIAMIAIRHSVPFDLVCSIAKAFPWTSDEKPPSGPLPRYDVHHRA